MCSLYLYLLGIKGYKNEVGLLKKKVLLIYLKGQGKEMFHLLVRSPNASHGWDWATRKARDPDIWVLHLVAANPRTWGHPVLFPRVCVSRELDQKHPRNLVLNLQSGMLAVPSRCTSLTVSKNSVFFF